jgi:hypothetical protein
MMKPQKIRALAARSVGVTVLLGAAGSAARADIAFGQLDDFQGGTTMGWMEGAPSPNPPTNIANGGPNGAGDRYVQNVASGGGGAGSKQIMFNQTQWTGNYGAVHVTRLNMMLANFGATALPMRISVQGGPSFTQYSSTNPVMVFPGAGWQPATFLLSSSQMTNFNLGPDSLATVLGSVVEVRLLAATAPNWIGDAVASTLGVDNIRALTIPGDANFSDTVDTIDFNVLVSNFSKTGKTWVNGDFDFNTTVDTVDFNLLASNFSKSVPAADGVTLVPEPALGAALLGLSFLIAPARRSK